MVIRVLALALAAGLSLAQDFHVYVGQLNSTSALIAWGRTRGGGNTIGRGSRPYGAAEVRIANRTLKADRNWLEVTGLQPDTRYEYEVDLDGGRIGGGTLRTWPERSDRLVFFVIGDYGTGSSRQYRVADAMWREFEKRSAGDNPVRFVVTVGDNIYSDVNLVYVSRNSGDQDSHWESKFFRPYQKLIAQVPFYPTLGNHDGNASESRGDLVEYLDNFFFPGNKPARWYQFSYGGLASFFALDTTDNSLEGRPRPVYTRDGEQFQWLAKALPAAREPWKIPYFHHPPFNAGPGHGSSLPELRHFVDLFHQTGVKVIFTGHEHNFQASEQSAATEDMLFVISGAGGELRNSDVTANMQRAHIAAWAPQRHFLVVEIAGSAMHITPLSYEQVKPRDPGGKPVPIPLQVKLP
jgi:hypothetical protein